MANLEALEDYFINSNLNEKKILLFLVIELPQIVGKCRDLWDKSRSNLVVITSFL